MPTKNKFYFWDFDKDPIFEGTLVGKIPNFPPWKKYVYVFETEKGGAVHMWGYLQIGKTLITTQFGAKVKITYHGKQEDPIKGYMIRAFTVEILETTDTKRRWKKKERPGIAEPDKRKPKKPLSQSKKK